MSLLEQREEGLHLVRWVRSDALAVGAQEYRHSVLVLPDAGVRAWHPTHVGEIDEAAVAEMLALAPALVLLGTGERQHLATPALQAHFLPRGIGLEAMSNAAAARTYNVLAGEGRRVLGAFLIPR